MALSLGSRRVKAPSGTVWRVGRRWLSRDLPKLRRLDADRGADAALESAWHLPGDIDIDIDLDELGGVIVVIAVAVIVLTVAVPLLIFGIELLVVILLLLSSILARTVFGHPWVVLAIPDSDDAETLAWKVTGWRRSSLLIEKVSAELASGATPLPDSPQTGDQT